MKTPLFIRFSTVAGERGAADAERDIRGFAIKFCTDEGNWDIVGNNTPVFFFRDPLWFPDLNHAIKRDPHTGLRSADNNWDFWTLLPEALHQVTIVMSDRGLPKSFRHMHGFCSHTFSMINAVNERVCSLHQWKAQQLKDKQAEATAGSGERQIVRPCARSPHFPCNCTSKVERKDALHDVDRQIACQRWKALKQIRKSGTTHPGCWKQERVNQRKLPQALLRSAATLCAVS
jgi:hypothetical protein